MSSFFTLPASQRKRKRTNDKPDKPDKPAKRRGVQNEAPESRKHTKNNETAENEDKDDSVSGSGSEADEAEAEINTESDATSEGDEDAAARRTRLAERYLDNIREEPEGAGFDAEEIDRELIAQRLKEATEEKKTRKYRTIASSLDFSTATHCLFRADTDTTTATAMRPPYVYTVSKDRTLIKWELAPPKPPQPASTISSRRPPPPPRRRPKQIAYVRGIKMSKKSSQKHGHTAPIISLAVSPCGTYLATGSSTDRRLIIWAASTLTPLRTFTVHRDSVTALSFAPYSQSLSRTAEPGMGAQLFSASADRTIKTFSLNGADSLAYVETLFGHQDHVLGIAAMDLDHCVSVGARDRTARYWKVVEETQSVFRTDSSRSVEYVTGSVDCVAALPPAYFVTGSDSGAIQLWTTHKKKPLFTAEKAHGVEDPEPLEKVSSETGKEVLERLKKADTRRPIPRAITALASVPGTDVIVSGSWDGWVRAWKVSDDKRSLIALGAVAAKPAILAINQHISNGVSVINGATEHMNGNNNDDHDDEYPTKEESGHERPGPIRGIINSLAVFERTTDTEAAQDRPTRGNNADKANGNDKAHGEADAEVKTVGLCIVAGTGKEPRLGRWRKFGGGRNGAVVMEVSSF